MSKHIYKQHLHHLQTDPLLMLSVLPVKDWRLKTTSIYLLTFSSIRKDYMTRITTNRLIETEFMRLLLVNALAHIHWLWLSLLKVPI